MIVHHTIYHTLCFIFCQLFNISIKLLFCCEFRIWKTSNSIHIEIFCSLITLIRNDVILFHKQTAINAHTIWIKDVYRYCYRILKILLFENDVRLFACPFGQHNNGFIAWVNQREIFVFFIICYTLCLHFYASLFRLFNPKKKSFWQQKQQHFVFYKCIEVKRYNHQSYIEDFSLASCFLKNLPSKTATLLSCIYF